MLSLTKIVLKIEREIFFLTGVILPTLRDQWDRDAIDIQEKLDDEHGTYYVKHLPI